MRLRRSIFPNSRDRDETETFQKTYRDRVSQFENTNWRSLSLDNLFLAGQIPIDVAMMMMIIIFFVIYPQAWCIAWMFTRLKLRDRDRDVISSRLRWDPDVEPSRPRQDVPKNVSRPPRSLETETFKNETTSLLNTLITVTWQPPSAHCNCTEITLVSYLAMIVIINLYREEICKLRTNTETLACVQMSATYHHRIT